tara:strand:+ start:1291 stop:1647 length:357 start_codon:yes stop_codon:yes gene_type:complete
VEHKGTIAVKVGDQTRYLKDMRHELDTMLDILIGREEPPIDSGISTLMEVATAYYARAQEMTARIQRAEASGQIPKNSPLYKFRTGELRTFTEVAKQAIELGSRRITAYKMEHELGYG